MNTAKRNELILVRRDLISRGLDEARQLTGHGKLRVLVVGEPSIKAVLGSSWEPGDEISVLGQVHELEDAIRAYASLRPEVVVVVGTGQMADGDLHHGWDDEKEDGHFSPWLTAARRLRRADRSTRIVIACEYPTRPPAYGVVRGVTYSCGAIAVVASDMTAADVRGVLGIVSGRAPGLRVLRFPLDHSVGKVTCGDDPENYLVYTPWPLGDAIGVFPVPLGMQVFLRAGEGFLRGVNWLEELKGDDLWKLDLTGCPVADRDLAAMQKLDGLKWLYLDSTGVTDEGLPRLVAFRALTQLSLYGTAVTEVGLPALEGLPSLRALDLRMTRITRQALNWLRTMQELNFQVSKAVTSKEELQGLVGTRSGDWIVYEGKDLFHVFRDEYW